MKDGKRAHNNLLTTSSQRTRKTEGRSSLNSCQIVFKGKIFYTDEKTSWLLLESNPERLSCIIEVVILLREWCWL